MKLHRNAKSTSSSRLLLVRRVLFEGWSYPAAATGLRTTAVSAPCARVPFPRTKVRDPLPRSAVLVALDSAARARRGLHPTTSVRGEWVRLEALSYGPTLVLLCQIDEFPREFASDHF